jgi:hypothetical protein
VGLSPLARSQSTKRATRRGISFVARHRRGEDGTAGQLGRVGGDGRSGVDPRLDEDGVGIVPAMRLLRPAAARQAGGVIRRR